MALTARWAAQSHLGSTARTVAVEAANLAAFGSLWIVQYVVLDRLLFHRRLPGAEPARDESADASSDATALDVDAAPVAVDLVEAA